MPRFTRRRFLQAAAASATAAVAGCGSDAAGDDTYADWLPAGDDYTLTAYVDFTLTEKMSRIDPLLPLILPSGDDEPGEFVPSFPSFENVNDPLVTFPLRIGGRIVALSSLSLAFAGLGYLVDPAQQDAGVTELFVANDTVVGTGDLDADRADEALRSGSPAAFDGVSFEAADEDGEYALYESATEESAAAAVSDSAVVLGDARDDVQAVIDARRGDRRRATEASDEFAWLFDTAGAGDILVGWHGPVELDGFYWGDPDSESQSDLGPVSPADDVAASVTFAPERDELTAGFALSNDETDATTKERLAGRLGAASVDADVTIDGDRLSAEATYNTGALDISFRDPEPTPEEPPAPGGDDLPPEVDAAVPDGAFEFESRTGEETIRVNFAKDVRADSVTVASVEAGWETSTSTVDATTYLAVPVDPGGDEVVVTVTVDGVSGVVARHEVE